MILFNLSLARPLLGLCSVFLLVPLASAADAPWVELFNGRSLDGWKASENPNSFRVVDGTISADGPRSHLFYVGPDATSFKDFELSFEVKAEAGANSGVFFHTAWQDSGWPSQGFEIQVNHAQKQHGDYLELKKTGSLYGIRNVYVQLVPDATWCTVTARVQRPRVQIAVNGTLVIDYIEPVGALPAAAPKLNRIGEGTFALQCHDPESRVAYRNLRVRRLGADSAADRPTQPQWDAAAVQRYTLGRDNFPLIDLHTHLKGGLTIERALQISRETGMGLGIATNGGQGFPIQNDAAALAFIEVMRKHPVFLALQAEGREWVTMFAPETRAAFDYVFTDSMTFTNRAGKRLRLWIPEEADIGPDPEAFMDELVEQSVRIIAEEPIDIWVNPTFLPEQIAPRYRELWTKARMQRVIDAAVKHHVAIEINARYRLPSEDFLRLAKAAGARFTFGTNNTSAEDFGDWSYPLEMQQKLGLTWRDMWVPGHQPSRAQRELAR